MKTKPSQRELTLFRDNFIYYLDKWINEDSENRNQKSFALTVRDMEGKGSTEQTIMNQISKYRNGEKIPNKTRLKIMNEILGCDLMDENRFPFVGIVYKRVKDEVSEQVEKELAKLSENLPLELSDREYDRECERIEKNLYDNLQPEDYEEAFIIISKTSIAHFDESIIRYVKFYSNEEIELKNKNSLEKSENELRNKLYQYYPFWEGIKKKYGSDLIDIGKYLCGIGLDRKEVCIYTNSLNNEIYNLIDSKMNTYKKISDFYFGEALYNETYKPNFTPKYHFIHRYQEASLEAPLPHFFEIPEEEQDTNIQEGVE